MLLSTIFPVFLLLVVLTFASFSEGGLIRSGKNADDGFDGNGRKGGEIVELTLKKIFAADPVQFGNNVAAATDGGVRVKRQQADFGWPNYQKFHKIHEFIGQKMGGNAVSAKAKERFLKLAEQHKEWRKQCFSAAEEFTAISKEMLDSTKGFFANIWFRIKNFFFDIGDKFVNLGLKMITVCKEADDELKKMKEEFGSTFAEEIADLEAEIEDEAFRLKLAALKE